MLDPEVFLPAFDTFEILYWAAWVARDFSAAWALGVAGLALLLATLGLLTGRDMPLDSQASGGGMLAWLVGALGCVMPLEKGLLFPRWVAMVALGLSLLAWGMVVVIRRVRR